MYYVCNVWIHDSSIVYKRNRTLISVTNYAKSRRTATAKKGLDSPYQQLTKSLFNNTRTEGLLQPRNIIPTKTNLGSQEPYTYAA